jgi:hypothetical protein
MGTSDEDEEKRPGSDVEKASFEKNRDVENQQDVSCVGISNLRLL